MSRCDSAAIVPKTSELLPEPETPVNTVSRRLGISMLTSLRLFTRAPSTRIRSWESATWVASMATTRARTRDRRVSILHDEPGAQREQGDPEDLRGGDGRARDAEPPEVVDHHRQCELARDRDGGEAARAERPHRP